MTQSIPSISVPGLNTAQADGTLETVPSMLPRAVPGLAPMPEAPKLAPLRGPEAAAPLPPIKLPTPAAPAMPAAPAQENSTLPYRDLMRELFPAEPEPEGPAPVTGIIDRTTRNLRAGALDMWETGLRAGSLFSKTANAPELQRDLREMADETSKRATNVAPPSVDFYEQPLTFIFDGVTRNAAQLGVGIGLAAVGMVGGLKAALLGGGAALAYTGVQAVGSLSKSAYEAGATDETINQALIYGVSVPYALTEFVAARLFAKTLLGGADPVGGMMKRMAVYGTRGAAIEGTGEVGQTALERTVGQQYDPNVSLTDADARKDYLASFAVGGVLGGGVGAVSGIRTKPEAKPNEPGFEDTGKPATAPVPPLPQLPPPEAPAGLLPAPKSPAQWASDVRVKIAEADAKARADDPNYQGDPALPQVLGVLRQVEQAQAKIDQIDKMPPEQRNSEQNISRRAAAVEALQLADMMMSPREDTARNFYVLRFGPAGKRSLDAGAVRVKADELGPIFTQNGERLSVTEDGQPIPAKKGATIYARTHAGTDVAVPRDAELMNLALPTYRNRLATPQAADLLNRLAERARAEESALRAQQANAQAEADAASPAGARRAAEIQGAAANLPSAPAAGTQLAAPPPTLALPAPQGRTYGDGFVMFDDSTPGLTGAQSPFGVDDATGQRTMRFPEAPAPARPSAPADTADSAAVSDPAQPALPGVPMTPAQAEAQAIMRAARETLQQRSVLDFADLPQDIQERVRRANIRAGAKEVDPKTITREQLVEAGVPDETTNALFRRAEDDAALLQSSDAVQRAGLQAEAQRGVRGIMSFFTKLALPDRIAMRRMLRALEKSLGRELGERDVVNLAGYLARDPKLADQGIDAAAAFLPKWLSTTTNGIVKGAIALRVYDPQDPLSRKALRNVAHELTHMALRVRLGDAVGARMQALYDHLQTTMGNDPDWQRIRSHPKEGRGGYGDMLPRVQAEEFLVAKIEQALAGQFGDNVMTARSLPQFVLETLKQVIAYAREFFTPATGSDVLTDLFGRAERDLGFELQPAKPRIETADEGALAYYRRVTAKEIDAADNAKLLSILGDTPAFGYARIELQAFREKFAAKDGWAQPELKDVQINGDPALRGSIELVFKEIPWSFAGDLKKERKGSPEYAKRVKTVSKRLVAEYRAIEKRAANGGSEAVSMLAQRGWYRDFRRQAAAILGDRYDLFADVLGATSPQMPVFENFRQALDVLTQFSQGKFDEALKAYADYIAKNGEDATDKGYDGPRVRQSNGAEYGVNTMNVMRALLGYARDTRTVTGNPRAPKTVNFTGNLTGSTEKATIDLWAARILQRLAKEDRIPPTAATGVKGKFNAAGTQITGQFGFGQDVFDAAAAEVGLASDELQAVAWFIEKEIWETNNWTRVEGGSYSDELLKYNLAYVTAGVTTQTEGSDASLIQPGTRLDADMGAPGSNTVPTTQAMLDAMAPVADILRKSPDVVSFTATPTLGLYGSQFERSFALSGTVKSSFDLGNMTAEVFALADQNMQADAFVSVAVPPDRVDNALNARPGLTVRFKKPMAAFELLPIIKQLQENGIDGFTVLPDSTDKGLARGLSAQAVPEMTLRWDADLRQKITRDPGALEVWMADREAALARSSEFLVKHHANISTADLAHFDTFVSGKGTYERDSQTVRSLGDIAGKLGSKGAWGNTLREAVARRLADLEGPDAPAGVRVSRSDGADDIPFFRREGAPAAGSGDGAGRVGDGRFAALPLAPTVRGVSGPIPHVVETAERYARENGITLVRQASYVEVDPGRAKRIADAYEAMPHAPNDPVVQEAYRNLIGQTLAQYRALEAAGYKFWFVDPATPEGSAYLASPWNTMFDLRNNRSMGIYPTNDGFGSGDFDPAANPLLADTGIVWPVGGTDSGRTMPVMANDLFRAVHDVFGHGMEGASFRAQGEENAWQAHVRLFTGSAVAALTSETRGQNSWVNYGPNGEKNRTAQVQDTVFAEQKTGLLPEWTWTEGRAADEGDAILMRRQPAATVASLLDDQNPSVRSDPQSRKEFTPDPASIRAARKLGFDTDRVLYFGSPTGAKLVRDGVFDVSRFDDNANYGPGVYLTDYWVEARGYAMEGDRQTGGGQQVSREDYDPRTMAAFIRVAPNERLYTGEVYTVPQARRLFGVSMNERTTGEEIYRKLSDKLGSNRKANEYLAAKGIFAIEHTMVNQFRGPGVVPGARVTNVVVTDPARVRLIDAAFAPSRVEEEGLLLRRETNGDEAAALFARVAPQAQAAGPMKGPGPLPKWLYRAMENEFFNFVFAVSSYGSMVANAKNTQAGRALANLLQRSKYALGGNGAPIQDEGYHGAVEGQMAKFNADFIPAINSLTNKQVTNLAKVLRGGYGLTATGSVRVPSSSGLTAQQAAQIGAIQKTLSDAYDYLRAALIAGGRKASEIPPKLRAYFPQHWMIEGSFDTNFDKPKLRGQDRRAVVTAWLKSQGVYKNGGMIDGRKADQDAMLKQMLDRMLGMDGRVSYGFDLFDALDGTLSIQARQEFERILNFPGNASAYLIKDAKGWRPALTRTGANGNLQVEKGAVEVELSDLLDNDAPRVLHNHLITTIRRAEFAKRMGAGGKKFSEYLDQIDAELKARGDEPLDLGAQQRLKAAVKANFGMLGRGFRGEHPGTYEAFSAMRMVADVTFLSLSAFSSLPETFMPLVRMGLRAQTSALAQNMRELLRTPKTLAKATAAGLGAERGDKWRAFKNAYAMDNSEMRQFAQDVVGTIMPTIHHAMMENVETGSHSWVENVRNRFFWLNLLQPLTEAQRVGATAAAVTYIGSLKARYEKGGLAAKRAERQLREIGLTYADVKNYDKANYQATMNDQIAAAIRQVVNETVLSPNPSQKPTYFSDPRFMLLSHIRSYQTAFTNTVLQRVVREALGGGGGLSQVNISPLLGLSVVVMMGVMLYELREWIRFGDEGNPFYNRLGLEKGDPARTILTAMDRGGLWAFMQPFVDAFLGSRIGKNPNLGSAFSPSIGMAESYLKGMFKVLLPKDEQEFRQGVSEITRNVPILNMLGEARQDLVTQITGIAPGTGGGGGGNSGMGSSMGSSMGSGMR